MTDDPDRMPQTTTVVFVDRAGNQRTAVRHRGGEPQDQSTGAPIDLDLADMGQGASGRLARGYSDDPSSLRRFLDVFVDLETHEQEDLRLLESLKENGDTIIRMASRRAELRTQLIAQLAADGSELQQRVAQWRAQHEQWQNKMEDLRRQLDAQGLKVQAGEIVRVTTQLNTAREKVRQLLERKQTRTTAEQERTKLVASLGNNRDAEHQRRKATLKTVVKHVNEQAEGLRIHVAVDQDADDTPWCSWLTKNLGFRMPRAPETPCARRRRQRPRHRGDLRT